MRRLEGRNILLTGAASGIGKATAERLADEGAHVFCTDVQEAAVEATADGIRTRGGDAVARVCDVGDPASIEATVEAAVAHFGTLHALCNIAGILHFVHTHEETLEAWNRVLTVNLTGTFLMCRAAIPHLLASRGTIVNMSSTAALKAHAWTSAYSASKGGVLAFTYGLAIEYGKQGLRVNAVCPGGIETPIHEAFALPEGANPNLLKRIMPFDGHRGPEDVAGAIAFLVSDDARHVNGSMIRVDGAMCT